MAMQNQPVSTVNSVVRGLLLLATLAVSILNGRPYSTYFDPMLFWLGKLAGPKLVASPVVFHGTSLAITLATLMVSAIPALLIRFIAGRWIGLSWQAGIWLLTAAAISWPSLHLALGWSE